MELVDVVAKMDEHLAQMDARAEAAAVRHEGLLMKMDEHLATQDLILAKMDERSARLAELMAQCHHEATAAHQAAATVMSRYAEVNLSVDAFLTVARELLAEWRRQRQHP